MARLPPRALLVPLPATGASPATADASVAMPPLMSIAFRVKCVIHQSFSSCPCTSFHSMWSHGLLGSRKLDSSVEPGIQHFRTRRSYLVVSLRRSSPTFSCLLRSAHWYPKAYGSGYCSTWSKNICPYASMRGGRVALAMMMEHSNTAQFSCQLFGAAGPCTSAR